MSGISITRGVYWADKMRKYKVFIDNVYQGDIMGDETKVFPVGGGHHTVKAKIDWCGSNELSVNVGEGLTELEVGPSLRGIKFWIPFSEVYYVLLARNKYLWLGMKGGY